MFYNSGFGNNIGQTFDGLDHLQTRTDGLGNVTQYSFDGEGLLEKITDPDNNSTNYQYNDLRSLAQVTDANGGMWTYGYDANQNLTSVADPLSDLTSNPPTRVTSYTYDILDRLSMTTQPGNLLTTYGYDDNGNRNSIIDPKGQTTGVIYDPLDRPGTINYSGTTGDGPTGYVYGYDPEANITSVQETLSVSGQVQNRGWILTYDPRNHLSTYQDPLGHSIGYGYDPANNVTSLTDAAGNRTIYGYDPLNRVSTVTAAGEQLTYGWNPNDSLANVTYTNGMTRTYGYDDANRLSSVKNLFVPANPAQGVTEQSQEFDYGYDANANVLSEVRSVNTSTTRTIGYGYDNRNRVQTATYQNGDGSPAANYTYGYDPVGNRTSLSGSDFTGTAQNLTFTYDNLSQLQGETGDPAGSVAFNYDNNGNLISKAQGGQTTTYNYDVRDQLRSISASGGSGPVASFDYDFQRRRLAKTTASGGLAYVYDDDRVINEFSSSGSLVNLYDWGADLARGEIAGEGERFYFSDALGSVTALSGLPTASGGGSPGSSATLGPAATYEYDAWGTVITDAGSANTFGYTGQKLDPETNLMGLGNGERYYSPDLGRLIQQDSFGGALDLPGTLNRHSYVTDNPLRYIDPSGHAGQQSQYQQDGYIDKFFTDWEASVAYNSKGNSIADWDAFLHRGWRKRLTTCWTDLREAASIGRTDCCVITTSTGST